MMNNNDILNQKLNDLIIKKTNELNNLQNDFKMRNNLKKYFKKITVSLYFIGLILAFLFYLKWGIIISFSLMIVYIICLKLFTKYQNNYLKRNYPLPKVDVQQLEEDINYLKKELERNKTKELNKDISYDKEALKSNNNNLVRKLIKK